jgi:predicted short-subunit dehydrogenase-like oxidoreductase (DUF2520 family)
MQKIILVGSGRVARHLGRRLKSKGLPIAQVVGRTAESVSALATTLGCSWTTDYAEVLPDADWLLIAVRDDAIEWVGAELAQHVPAALATHTSGATPGHALATHFERYGVFYPLQSFSVERQPVWSKIPFCIDAASAEDVHFLRKTAKIIGNLVYQVNDAQRSVLHVAAVFANNFSNHCFAIAEKILDDADLPFEMLHPLMEETLAKALQDSPARMQTGPAVRGDADTLTRHLRLLELEPEWREIYRLLSENIAATQARDALKNPE